MSDDEVPLPEAIVPPQNTENSELGKFREELDNDDTQDPDAYVHKECVDAFGKGKDGFKRGPLKKIAETHKRAAKYAESDEPGATGQLLVEMQTLHQQAGFGGEYKPEVMIPEGSTEARKQELIREKMRADYREFPGKAVEKAMEPVLRLRAEVRIRTDRLHETVQQEDASRADIRQEAYDLERARLKLNSAEVVVVENVQGGDVEGVEVRQIDFVFGVESGVDEDWEESIEEAYRELRKGVGGDGMPAVEGQARKDRLRLAKESVVNNQRGLEAAMAKGDASEVCRYNNRLRRSQVSELAARREIQMEVYEARIETKMFDAGGKLRRVFSGEARKARQEARVIEGKMAETRASYEEEERGLKRGSGERLAGAVGGVRRELAIKIDLMGRRKAKVKSELGGVYSRSEARRAGSVGREARGERRKARRRANRMENEQKKIARKRTNAHKRHLETTNRENRSLINNAVKGLQERGVYPVEIQSLQEKDTNMEAFMQDYEEQFKEWARTDYSDNKAFQEMNGILLEVTVGTPSEEGERQTKKDRLNNLEHHRSALTDAIARRIGGDKEMSKSKAVEALGAARRFVEENSESMVGDADLGNLEALIDIGEDVIGRQRAFDDARRAEEGG